MTKYSAEITEERISALIKSELKLSDLPKAQSFYDLGFKVNDLVRIQTRMARAFGRTVGTVFYQDSVVALCKKLTSKPNTDERNHH